jgi:hypothetical protein
VDGILIIDEVDRRDNIFGGGETVLARKDNDIGTEGYDCDYNMMPTKSVRRQFLTEYTKSYCEQRGLDAYS